MDSTLPDPASPLLASRNNGVLTLTINRPDQYNALSEAVLQNLEAALDAAAADNEVRVVVITGAGKAFCAGHDLKEMQSDRDATRIAALFKRCSTVMQKIAVLPQPVVAAVNGTAVAAGCQLVAQCDLAVAVTTAKFGVSGVSFGLFCSTPAVALSRNLGRKRAMQMLMTGEMIDAKTALEWGLVNVVESPGAFDAAVQDIVGKLLSKPASALAMGKQLFYHQLEMGMAAAYQEANATITCNFMNDDAKEGIDAFIQKRPPEWPGR